MMKNISIEVPASGAVVQLVLRPGAHSGQAVIVASDDVEIRIIGPSALPRANNGKGAPAKVSTHDLDAIHKRLAKLRPSKRAAAINSIKAMFHLTAPITDEVAGKILEDLRRRGSLTIDNNDKLRICEAK